MFTVAGLFFIFTNNPDSSWTETKGTVVNVQSRAGDSNTMYSAVVEYTVDGNSYTVVSSMSSSSAPDIGSERKVAYNPNLPQEAKIVESLTSTWWLYLFPLAGLTMIVLSILSYIRSKKRTSEIGNLQVRGVSVKGVVVELKDVGRNDNNTMYKVVVAANDLSGNVKHYLSDPINNVEGLAFTNLHQNPIAVDVFLDPNNPDNYYVDIADIPQLSAPGLSDIISHVTNSIKNPDAQNDQAIKYFADNNPVNTDNTEFSAPDDESQAGWGAK